MTSRPTSALQLRVQLDDNVRFGPGKADLLEGIADTGSISAAGRRMRMSYRRAWELAEAINADFGAPLVQTLTGGKGGGGTQLTPLGTRVLAAYRRLQAACEAAAAREIATLRRARSAR